MSDTGYLLIYPSVEVDGAALTGPWDYGLTSVRVDRQIGTTGHAFLRYFVNPLDDIDLSTFGVGAALRVTAVLDDVGTDVFSGEILATGVEVSRRGQMEVTVEAFEAAYKLQGPSATAAFVDSTIGDVVSSVAADCGLSVTVNASDTETYPVVQVAGTARQILDRLAFETGCQWWVDDGTLYFQRPDASAAASKTFTYGLDLLGVRLRTSHVDGNASVGVVGWDPETKRKVAATATRAGSRTGALTAPSSRVVRSETEATTMATAIKERLDAIATTGRVEVLCAPDLKLGDMIQFAGVPGYEATYLINRIVHEFDNGDGTTTLDVGPYDPTALVDMMGGGSRHSSTMASLTSGVTIGVVSDNHDPDGINRVKVTLPFFDDIVSTWARLVQPGAGSGRGWHVLPEVGDEVLVTFEHGDMRHPYVLGGLWNSTDAPPVANDDAFLEGGYVHSRSFTSLLGHKLEFSDVNDDADAKVTMSVAPVGKHASLMMSREKIELTTPAAKEIKIGNQDASITLDAEGNIEIKAKSVTITSTDQNVEITAKGDLVTSSTGDTNVSATGKATVESVQDAKLAAKGGNTTISGLQVKVN